MQKWMTSVVSALIALSAIALWAGVTGGYKGCSTVKRDNNVDVQTKNNRNIVSSHSTHVKTSHDRPAAFKSPVYIDKSCIFCSIFSGTKAAHVYAQNVDNLMFRSLSGGVLVIPKAHIESLKQLDDSTIDEVTSMILFASEKIRELPQFKHKQYQRAYFHTGRRAGQTVFHLHMHVWLSDSVSACRSMIDARGSKKLSDNQDAVLFRKNNHNKVLYVQFRQPLGHLGTFDVPSSKRLARGLLLASEYIRNHFPQNDYATDIDNVCDNKGNKTVEIAIRLR